ncbi:MAG TPA: alpha/beta fold hydrolase [Thermoanaerobaculia bacterium]
MSSTTEYIEKLRCRKSSPADAAMMIAAGVLLGAGELIRRRFRHSKLFCPKSAPLRTWDPRDYGLDPDRVEQLTFRSSDGRMLHAWYCRARDPIASIFYCHGNTGNLTHSADAVPNFLTRGLSVFLFDYRGFGKSQGFPTIRGVVRDAIAAAKVHDVLRQDEIPSILFGYSLGGAVAAYVPRHVHFDGMVLQSTFTNVREMAKHLFTRIPLYLISGNPLDTASELARCNLPLLVIHGTADGVIPCSMADQLFENYRGRKEKCMVEGARHTDLFELDGDRIFESLLELAREIRGDEPIEPETEERIA